MHLLPDPAMANITTANTTDFLEADTDTVEELLHDGFMLQDLSVVPTIDTTPHTHHHQTHPPTQTGVLNISLLLCTFVLSAFPSGLAIIITAV